MLHIHIYMYTCYINLYRHVHAHVCVYICTQALMQQWYELGSLIEGHWGVERGDENDQPHGQGGNVVMLKQTLTKKAEDKLKAMYRPLADAIAARALVEFAALQEADPVAYRTLEVTMRISVNVHKDAALLMGYTGKWYENPEYRFASVGIDEARWLNIYRWIIYKTLYNCPLVDARCAWFAR